jgi:hypothetical protein
VVEARGAKAVTQLRVEAFVLAEDDAGDDRAALALEPRGHRPRNRRAEIVRDTADPTPLPDDPEAVGAEDDVDSLTREESALVELVTRFRRRWPLGGGNELQDGTLRRRATEWQLKPSGLVHRLPVPAMDTHGDSDREGARSRRPRDLEARKGGRAGLPDKGAPLEVGEAKGTPPEAEEEQGGS